MAFGGQIDFLYIYIYRDTVVCVFLSPAPVRQVVLGKLYFLMFVVPLVSSGLGGSRRSNGFLIYIYIYIHIYIYIISARLFVYFYFLLRVAKYSLAHLIS